MATEAELRCGAEIIKRGEQYLSFARRMVAYLYKCQTADERAEGTSIYRNGRGFCIDDARYVAAHGVDRISATKARSFVSKYSTQLAVATLRGELLLEESGDEDEDEDEDEEESFSEPASAEDNDEEKQEIETFAVTQQAVFNGKGRCILPAKRFSEAIVQIFHRVPENEFSSVQLYFQSVIDSVDKTLSVFERVSTEAVDHALYNSLPAADFAETPPGAYMRLYWVYEDTWSTIRVKQVNNAGRMNMTVNIEFVDENKTAVLCGNDLIYAYAIPYSDNTQPAKRRRLLKLLETTPRG